MAEGHSSYIQLDSNCDGRVRLRIAQYKANVTYPNFGALLRRDLCDESAATCIQAIRFKPAATLADSCLTTLGCSPKDAAHSLHCCDSQRLRICDDHRYSVIGAPMKTAMHVLEYCHAKSCPTSCSSFVAFCRTDYKPYCDPKLGTRRAVRHPGTVHLQTQRSVAAIAITGDSCAVRGFENHHQPFHVQSSAALQIRRYDLACGARHDNRLLIFPPLLAFQDLFSSSSIRHLACMKMDSDSPTKMTGVGVLTYQRAIDLARNTEGDLDPALRDYLHSAINDIWLRIQADPDYILTKDEFPLFNFYIRRFEGHKQAEDAIARYWSTITASKEA
nr:hypothetical protein CFP56_43820 [Quercus suber]